MWKTLPNKKLWVAMLVALFVAVSLAENPGEDPAPPVLPSSPNSLGDTSFHIETAITEEIAANMLEIEGGTFTMGCEKGTAYCLTDAAHPHQVELSTFLVSKYEVTQSQWQAVMGHNPSRFPGCADCPVETISWNDVQEFLERLNKATGKQYRLPTESEWEYAARGGKSPSSGRYAGSDDLDEVAWYRDNSAGKTHRVGGKRPNRLGIYDMAGNVYEWCFDQYDRLSYSNHRGKDPQGFFADNPKYSRVLRGGSWAYGDRFCISTYRDASQMDEKYPIAGFRLAHSLLSDSTQPPQPHN